MYWSMWNRSPFALSWSCLTKLQDKMYSLSFKGWALGVQSSSIIYSLSKWYVGLLVCSNRAPLIPAVMVIRGLTFHPCCVGMSINGWYFICLVSMVVSENQSWQFVNSINCIVGFGVGFWGMRQRFEAPNTHTMYGLSFVTLWQVSM